jgi:hypothetical protein
VRDEDVLFTTAIQSDESVAKSSQGNPPRFVASCCFDHVFALSAETLQTTPELSGRIIEVEGGLTGGWGISPGRNGPPPLSPA